MVVRFPRRDYDFLKKGLYTTLDSLLFSLPMGFTSLNHWMESDNTSELVDQLKTTNDVSKTLTNWFKRTTNEYNTSPEQDLCLVLEDGIITKDQVPTNLIKRTVRFLSSQINYSLDFKEEHERLIQQVL
jgi:hypothetical protein